MIKTFQNGIYFKMGWNIGNKAITNPCVRITELPLGIRIERLFLSNNFDFGEATFLRNYDPEDLEIDKETLCAIEKNCKPKEDSQGLILTEKAIGWWGIEPVLNVLYEDIHFEDSAKNILKKAAEITNERRKSSERK